MGEILVVATGGAGGDLPPLVAASLALRERGHEITFIGDASVQRTLLPLQVDVEVLPTEVDLGPRLASVVQEAMQASGSDLAKAGPMLQRAMTVWAHDVAEPIALSIERHKPTAIVTSLFGVEAVDATCPPCPWAVVNSTFYIGPNPPRPVEEDFGPRAIPLITRYAELLESADLVLHATDQVFDYSFDRLPSRHHYVGPLGIWEPPRERPRYLQEPGDPWVLVSISSQRQDDVVLADAAGRALADERVRVLVTLGPEHEPSELTAHPSNARVEKTVSHSAVLGQAALLVSHAGHGSVMKALWHGKPMVLVPWGRDQPGVAARAEALGVAEVVPCAQATAETIGAAVKRSLADQEMGRKAAKHSARLRATDPPAQAAARLESLLV
ncbi:MAG TPA: nucleotide disphospho-sugar-binding domain-containing protein [Candidatus Dormibacteraeota bacterium]|nr:nucleotide disphospho-sugar-binding domain-containing protein [Candidatus Dormibacteraeota bacterium]